MARPIELHRSFVKSYKKRIANNAKLASQYRRRVQLFIEGVRGTPLDDHMLTGSLIGHRAFSITSEVRIIYKETGDKYIFIDIGTHNQVYGD